MIKLDNLNRQHNTIIEEINIINAVVKGDDSTTNTKEAALHISRLAGQLKIHLLEEDKYLYPELLQSSDRKVQTMAKQYINEMGNLSLAYSEYKNSYNVASKIEKNMDSFIRDTKSTMEALINRMSKEDNELYTLIREQNI